MPTVISVENLSKTYPSTEFTLSEVEVLWAGRLGQIGMGRFRRPFGRLRTAAQPNAFTPFGPRELARRGETANDLKLWWAKVRGKPG